MAVNGRSEAATGRLASPTKCRGIDGQKANGQPRRRIDRGRSQARPRAGGSLREANAPKRPLRCPHSSQSVGGTWTQPGSRRCGMIWE